MLALNVPESSNWNNRYFIALAMSFSHSSGNATYSNLPATPTNYKNYRQILFARLLVM